VLSLLIILQLILLVLAILVLLWLIFLLSPALFGGQPFVPTDYNVVKQMIKLASIKAGDMVVDLGSGDGRILLAAAQMGAQSIGYEINPGLVWYSRFKLWQSHVGSRAKVYNKNFWPADLSRASVVTVYGFSTLMPRLAQKLRRELKPGSRVVSFHYQFGDWSAQTRIGQIYLYKV